MPTGLTKDAGWQVGISRTLDAPIDRVWEALTSPQGVGTWLGSAVALPDEAGAPVAADTGEGEIRSFRPRDRIRLRWRPTGWSHATTLQLAVTAKGRRTVLRIHQERLADARERERQRAHWSEVMDRLEESVAVG